MVTTIQFLILLLILLSNLYWIFFKDYSREKGKNTATKEDIEEITTKIESVKLELENFQTKKKDFLEQNKIALLTLYDEFLHWSEHDIRNVHVSIDDVAEPNKIKQQINILNLQQSKVEKAFWRLCLFELNNNEIIRKFNELYRTVETRQDYVLDYLYQMENLSASVKLHDRGIISNVSNEQFNNITKNYYDKFEKDELSDLDIANQLMNLIRTRFTELYQ